MSFITPIESIVISLDCTISNESDAPIINNARGRARSLRMSRHRPSTSGTGMPVIETIIPAIADKIMGLPKIFKATAHLRGAAELFSENICKAITARRFCKIIIKPARMLARTKPSRPR